ncbi:dienelactone hydrolase [Colletotrichum graminicola]|uniref:Dienelactone hydrolase n=1 Tax=Colletotrichum graminicola (strain M1.001 / M2 / FGSC 10212) TaxID=645133 RepID=E3QY07_COLGM|nr:dienelactone hydrolase [Colletotrichum graminicola M1.001]EFQ35745.1 dienelactone hydrolase [Colletotrichum graminicola M1.001]WDK10310.1 dienelactone hydrolase [Colletotrichum graminicola]
MADINDPVLAKPADLCCLRGDFHNGEPTGNIIQIEGVDSYVAKPDPKVANGNVLLFFPDAFGLHINSKLMMDAYAACGYLTLGVDYFLGDAVTKYTVSPLTDPNFDLAAWSAKHLGPSEEVGREWVKNVKAKYGGDGQVKFGCVGYCWGARFVLEQLSEEGICAAGAIAHPSFVNESHVQKSKAPVAFSVPATDKLFSNESRARVVEICTEKQQRFNMQIFSHVGHGFASRTRLTDPYELWAKEQHFKGFIEWFDFWLAQA